MSSGLCCPLSLFRNSPYDDLTLVFTRGNLTSGTWRRLQFARLILCHPRRRGSLIRQARMADPTIRISHQEVPTRIVPAHGNQWNDENGLALHDKHVPVHRWETINPSSYVDGPRQFPSECRADATCLFLSRQAHLLMVWSLVWQGSMFHRRIDPEFWVTTCNFQLWTGFFNFQSCRALSWFLPRPHFERGHCCLDNQVIVAIGLESVYSVHGVQLSLFKYYSILTPSQTIILDIKIIIHSSHYGCFHSFEFFSPHWHKFCLCPTG